MGTLVWPHKTAAVKTTREGREGCWRSIEEGRAAAKLRLETYVHNMD